MIPEDLITKIQTANYIAVLTGAGISAESGIPTFREAQTGLWAQYNPEELATPSAFIRNPRLVWEWYAWRRSLVSQAEPNPGHLALAQLEKMVPRFTLITQNVDGLHQRAGSTQIITLHGDITRIKCFNNNHPITEWDDSQEVPPHCPRCDSLLRPDVVWFGESLSTDDLSQAITAAETCDVFFSIGTAALVHPAASLPGKAAHHGAVTIEINPQHTMVTRYMDYVLTGPSGEILPQLLKKISPKQ